MEGADAQAEVAAPAEAIAVQDATYNHRDSGSIPFHFRDEAPTSNQAARLMARGSEQPVYNVMGEKHIFVTLFPQLCHTPKPQDHPSLDEAMCDNLAACSWTDLLTQLLSCTTCRATDKVFGAHCPAPAALERCLLRLMSTEGFQIKPYETDGSFQLLAEQRVRLAPDNFSLSSVDFLDIEATTQQAARIKELDNLPWNIQTGNQRSLRAFGELLRLLGPHFLKEDRHPLTGKYGALAGHLISKLSDSGEKVNVNVLFLWLITFLEQSSLPKEFKIKDMLTFQMRLDLITDRIALWSATSAVGQKARVFQRCLLDLSSGSRFPNLGVLLSHSAVSRDAYPGIASRIEG